MLYGVHHVRPMIIHTEIRVSEMLKDCLESEFSYGRFLLVLNSRIYKLDEKNGSQKALAILARFRF